VANYELEVKKSAAKEIADLPSKDIQRIVEKIRDLRSNPRPAGSEKLSGDAKYRIRQGTYRVLYEIDDLALTVTVVKIAHRREVYRK
jgi:mRNA interferase RelE/StbE